ncbi:hypothetical protein [Micromonospora carbonacea]|uniref:hypothetical protein n=1 Tax=Micromonospora carbonacea TaxID=47853 RepID=UPI003721F78B
MRRTLIAFIAAVGLILALPGTASAHDTDDWYKTSSIPSGFGYVGLSASHVGNVYQEVAMWRSNNYLVLQGYASDIKDDGYCGAVQITYETYDYSANKWSGHWHTRAFALVDCTTGDINDGKHYKYARSSYQFRNVYSRACHASSSGSIVECESNWHGPI